MTKTNQEDLQGKVRKELSALELIGIQGISTLRKKPLLEIDESDKQPAQSIQTNIPDTKSIQKDNVKESITTEEKVDIKSNYHKFDNDVSDVLALYQTPIEQVIYHRLYRLSYGYNRNTCQVGMGALAKACNISSSEKTVKKAIDRLIEKGHIAIVDEHNNSKLGTKYRIFLPREITGIESRSVVKNTVVDFTTVNNTTVPQTMMNKQSTPTVVNSTVVDFTGNIYLNNKDTLSLREIVILFYKEIGQKKISKQKRERAEDDIKELLQEGFSEKDIAFAVKWTIANSREKPYDFSLIKETIGQAMAEKDKAEKKESDKLEKEKILIQKQVEEEKQIKIQEKIIEYKNNLDDNHRKQLREEALNELQNTKGIRKEFITEILIEAKENELLKIQIEKNGSK